MDSQFDQESIPSLEDDAKLSVIKEAYRDPVFFCKYFLPNYFPAEIVWLHRGLLAILTEKTEFLWEYGEVWKIVTNFTRYEEDGTIIEQIFIPKVNGVQISFDELKALEEQGKSCDLELNLKKYVVLMIPRGFGKTTVAGVAVPLYEILYHEWNFGVTLSEAGPHAEMQMGNIKRELEGNERIIQHFGDIVPSNTDSEKWTDKIFETRTGVAMTARGRGAQVRGLNFAGSRPKKVICDDLEDKESVSTSHQLEKVKTWAYGDLLPCLADDGRLVALGTRLGEECLMVTWRDNPEFTAVVFGALDRQGDYLWERKINEKSLEAKKQSFALAGQLHVFYLEYFNQVVSQETHPFSGLVYLNEYMDPSQVVASSIYIDPAISQKTTADDTVITVSSRGTTGKIYARRQVGGKFTPREMLDHYFKLAREFNVRFHGYESVAFQASLKHTFQEEMFRAGYYFEPIPVPHTKKKAERFLGVLYPRIASGYIAFEGDFSKCIAQLRTFNPEKKENKDDWPDSLCGSVELLDPVAAAAAGQNLAKDVYKPLSEELGDWRLV
jgi:predicted phage terminase large subunit-like protein